MRGEASVFRFHEGANRSPECNPFHKRGAWEPTLRLQLVENGGCLPFAGWYEMCQQLHRSRPSFGSWNFMCRLWPAILLCLISSLSLAVTTPDKSPAAGALQTRERRFTRSLVRAAQFVDVRHISSRPSCGDVQPPDALTTPDPLFTTSAFGHKVKVSFIIGIDGRVHSPLILESAGLAGDRRVLQTVRTWSYRPATCNGVPTETEGKVEFSSR